MESKKWKIEDMPDLSGKNVIVTGANSGLGYEAAKALASIGAHVIMASRNMERSEKAKNEILKDVPNASLDSKYLDLSDLSSVREFAENYRKEYDTLDLLLNNAGILGVPKRIETVDGLELQLAVNHFGHFALTGLLYNMISNSKGRIVTTSSPVAHNGKIDFENLNWEKSYSPPGAYDRSKVANLFFAFELDRRIRNANNGVKSIAAHPGLNRTPIHSTGPAMGDKTLISRFRRFSYILFGRILFGQSPEKGIRSILYAATSPDVNGGEFYVPSGMGELRGPPRKVSPSEYEYAYDESIGKKLWEESEKLTGVKYPI